MHRILRIFMDLIPWYVLLRNPLPFPWAHLFKGSDGTIWVEASRRWELANL